MPVAAGSVAAPEGKDGALVGIRWRRRPLAAALVVMMTAGVVTVEAPRAPARAAEAVDASAAARVHPAAVVDIGDFAARARAWAVARERHREAALARAVSLAAQTKAREAAEERARLEAEERARREAEERARREAEAAATSTTTVAATATTTSVAVTSTTLDGEPVEPTDEATVDAVAEPPADGPTPDQWAALRACESGGNYQAVSPTGRYRGAYQFSITTWDWLAATRYPQLVGVDPVDASVADQDAMAYALYALYGANPWPVCGRNLP